MFGAARSPKLQAFCGGEEPAGDGLLEKAAVRIEVAGGGADDLDGLSGLVVRSPLL